MSSTEHRLIASVKWRTQVRRCFAFIVFGLFVWVPLADTAFAQTPMAPQLLVESDKPVEAVLSAEFVDSTGTRRNQAIVNGSVISGTAPFAVQFDASGSRGNRAFASQTAVNNPEAFAFLHLGYRINFGEPESGLYRFPEGSNYSRSEETGPPLFSRVFRVPGTYQARLAVRDGLGNADTITFTVNIQAPPPAVLVRVSDGRWPIWTSNTRYSLQAGGDYRSFGAIELGGLHNVVIEKAGDGPNPRIGVLSPDGRSKFNATTRFEPRARNLRFVDLDIGHFQEGQRGFEYVSVIGGMVRRFSSGGQAFLWSEGSDITRSVVRYSRGLFLDSTEVRNEGSDTGFVMFGTLRGLHVRDTIFRHVQNGPTTYLMLRVYGSYFSFRNNLWFSTANGGSSNGTTLSMLAMDGPDTVTWRDDDLVGPLTGSVRFGYVAEKMIAQHNQFYAEGSFVTNGVASTGGNPSGNSLVRPYLVGWEDNVWYPSSQYALAVRDANLAGRYVFWRNNRVAMGQGAAIPADIFPPNRSVGDSRTFNGPYIVESDNSRPRP